MTQAALAAQAGISASYLNLIEHGRREVAGALLRRLAGALGMEPAELSGQEEARLAQDLEDIAIDPVLQDLGLDRSGGEEVVGRRPEWARAVVRLHRRYQAAATLSEALSQRLAHDATLVEATHELLTRITSVRSFAEILQEHADVEPQRRERFLRTIAEESARLGDVAKSVFDRLSDFDESPRATTPAEEVDDFIIDRSNHFPDLEEGAERLGARLLPGGSPEAALARLLEDKHGIRIEASRPAPSARPGGRSGFDPAAKALHVPLGAPPARYRFQLARLAFRLEEGEAVTALCSDQRLTSPEARDRAADALYSYGAGALLFPYDRFRQAAEDVRYDLDHLGALFAASTEQVCHRLVTLRRPGAEGVPFAFLRVDPAGNISKRFSLPTLHLPRFGGVCPLWAIYRSFNAIGSLVTQRARLADGREFLFIARAVSKPPMAYGMPAETFAVMIACEALYGSSIVYGDSLANEAHMVVHSGINCHLCPQPACPQRAHPQVLAQAQPPAAPVTRMR